MMCETLRGGGLRLAGEAGAFVYQRLSPGVFLSAVRGRDTGEFGSAPLDIIDREYRLFGRPVEWFFDATRLEYTNGAVSGEWTAWLTRRPEVLRRMHILSRSERTRLVIRVASHFSNSSNRLALYTEPSWWRKALEASAPGQAIDPAARFEEPAVPVARIDSSGRGAVLEAPGCRWNFQPIAGGVIFSRFEGSDSGELTDLALDEMERMLAASEGKASWFLDLREAENVAGDVSRIWTEWLGGRQDRLARVVACAKSPLFPLVLTVAKFRSGTERLFRIHREIEPFRRELAEATSGEIAASAVV